MIVYGNVSVEGLPVIKILELNIHQNAGEHGYARLIATVDPEKIKEAIKRVDETSKIVIKSTKEPNQKLFVGGIQSIAAVEKLSHTEVTVEAVSTSFLMDVEPKSRSFQKKSMKYSEVVKEVMKDYGGVVEIASGDKAIDKPVIQWKETDWEFAQRMASEVGLLLCPDITADKPKLMIGKPKGINSAEAELDNFVYEVDGKSYQIALANKAEGGSTPMQEDFASYQFETPEYLFVGDKYTVNGTDYYVTSFKTHMEFDGLISDVKLQPEKYFATHVREPRYAFGGTILRAQVKEVKEDKIKVHLLDIDDKYDSSGDWEFPYATPYSSKDGAGWYVMPEKDDFVKVVFPTEDTKEAFASSANSTANGKDPKDKLFKAPKGKEILFTDKGIHIVCNDKSIFIDLTDDDGLRLVSSKDIAVSANGNVTLKATKDVKIQGGKEVNFACAASAVRITPADITLSAPQVKLG